MSGPVVAIGFILLIPSVLGVLFGIFMLFATGAASKQTSTSREGDIRADLVAQQVPEPIIAKVVAGEPVGDPELVSLTPEQRLHVYDAQMPALDRKVGPDAATVIAGGLSLVIIIASFVFGLLGWLLVMQKRVLQCTRCGSVVPAS